MRSGFVRIKEFSRQVKDNLLDLVFPKECVVCQREGNWLCPDCRRQIQYNMEQYCPECKASSPFGRYCSQCRSEKSLDGILVACDYESPGAAALIKLLKYQFVFSASFILGDILRQFLQETRHSLRLNSADLQTGIDQAKLLQAGSAPRFLFDPAAAWLAPVPLHRKRQAWRGFNQSEAIAASLAGQAGFKLLGPGLVRQKNTKPQAKLDREERLKNLAGSFAWTGGNLAGNDIVLIDDVATTGTTLDECARVLKAAGANEVWGLVVARN